MNQFEKLAVALQQCLPEGLENAAEPESTPNEWFGQKYPLLTERYGTPLDINNGRGGSRTIAGINEDFFAGTLGPEGTPDGPTVWVQSEGQFYQYSADAGIYVPQSEPAVTASLSGLLHECAKHCETNVDVGELKFRYRKTSNLKGVVERAKGILAVGQDYFTNEQQDFIPCGNGMLRLSDMTLLPFGPNYRRRNKLAVPFEPGAACPMFLDNLMKPALDGGDLDLLQRWCGLALIGVNLSQVLLILSGTAGGGKGTFIRVLIGILGQRNVASLRTRHLGNRFEVGRLLGSTLLHGADVPADFLNCEGASVLKSLTGGDPAVVELKGSNERPEVVCRFNAVVTCNSQLSVRLEGDGDAWRRRLRVIEYRKPASREIITDLSERILRDEGPGVLNWMLEGLKRIRGDGWQLHASENQRRRVEDLLMRSESHVRFVREGLVADASASLKVADCYEGYARFCEARAWVPLTSKQFSEVVHEEIRRHHHIVAHHDVMDRSGKPQRGWKGVRCS